MRSKFLILAVMLVGLRASAWDVRKDSEGDVVHWSHRVELVIDEKLAQQLGAPGAEAAVRAAIAHLDDATPFLDVVATTGAAKPIGYTVGATDNTNSIVVLEDWPYADEALAVTLVTLNARTNELLDADVAFNAEEHRFKVLPDAARRDESNFDDVQNTITHELGHVLGLMHNTAKEDLVMYPSAAPGEIEKRVLKQDDLDGLISLYGTAAPVSQVGTPTTPLDNVGCSSTGSSAPVWLFVVPLFTLLFPRRRLALAAVVVPSLAFAGEPSALRAAHRSDDVAVVQVTARQSFTQPQQPGVIFTRLTLSKQECLKGACGQLDEVIVLGGRVGDIEQYVAHEPVPLEGAQILVARRLGKVRLLRAEPAQQEALIRALRSGSPLTPEAVQPQPPSAQVPAITP